MPLFFTSVNSELFEFNKIILVYLFTILITGAWAGRMIWQRRLMFKRTFFDIPLVLFLASQVASTIFSIDIHTSLFGYYSRFNGSLLSTLCYLFLYWAFVSNCEVKDIHKVIKVSLVSAAIVSLYGIFEHFGHSFSCLIFQGNFTVDCWIQRVQERVFATLGQPNWLAAYLVILIPVAWAKMLEAKKNSIFTFYPGRAGLLLSTCYFLCLIFTGSRSGFLGLGVSTVVFWLTVILINKKQIKRLAKPLILTASFLLLATIIFGSPFPQINKYLYYKSFTSRVSTHNPPPQPDSQPTTHSQPLPQLSEDGGISQSSDIRKIVWKGAIDIFKHYPLFGSGVETFAYSYYNFRPIEHNLVTEWDFLYNKAHNEYLNYLATTGIFGLGTYLLFIVSFILYSISQIYPNDIRILPNTLRRIFGFIRPIRINSGKANRILIVALFSGWLSLLVTNFFGFSVVVTSLYFFLIPAFAIVLSKDSHLTPTSRSTSLPAVASAKAGHLPLLLPFVPLLLTTYYLLSTTINYWRADYFYSRAQKLTKQSNYPDAYQNLYQAKNLFPNEPVYLGDIATVTANLALMSNAQKDASAKSDLASAKSDLASATGELEELAINYSDQAKNISPKNLNVLKTRVRVFYTLSLIEPDHLKGAIEAMLEAITLAPTDPKLVYNLGLLYAKNDDSKLAIQTIEKAIQLKPNYIDARNALVLFYEDAGEKDKALEQLQILLKLAPENASEFGKQIDKLK